MGATAHSTSCSVAPFAPRISPHRKFLTLPTAIVFVAVIASCSYAQGDASSAPEKPPTTRGVGLVRFLLGGAAGLGLHESGHLLFDGVFRVEPSLKRVHFGPIPFVAITHPAGQPPRREFTISSAGFWMQHLSSEIVLTRHPHLHDERAPVVKGIVAFNVLASIAYGAAAVAKAGPIERDTRAMADSARVSERTVAALVIAPALLDAWRYFHPDSAWARWMSRGVKVGGVLLVVR